MSCSETEFGCSRSGPCIELFMLCDGIPQCPNLSDELDCAPDATVFTCLESGERVPVSLRCDGLTDCRDGTDEQGCYHFGIWKE